MPSTPVKRRIGLGPAALIVAVIGLLLGLFGTVIGILAGLVAIGLAIAGAVANSGRVMAVVGGFLGLVAVIASVTVPLRESSTPAASSPTPVPSVSAGATAPIGVTPTTSSTPPSPAPARAITVRDWLKIAKDPGAHTGESIVVYGTVTQFDSATGTGSFRADVDGVRHQDKYDYATNTYLTGPTSTLADLVEGDMFRAEVVVGDPYSYTTTMGGEMTVPSLVVTRLTPIT